jgi:stage V sporulation protein SpoVS
MKNSKSRFVRGAVMEMVKVCADNWPADVLRKCAAKIRELTDIGITDAGPSARDATREALAALNKKLPDASFHSLFLYNSVF